MKRVRTVVLIGLLVLAEVLFALPIFAGGDASDGDRIVCVFDGTFDRVDVIIFALGAAIFLILAVLLIHDLAESRRAKRGKSDQG